VVLRERRAGPGGSSLPVNFVDSRPARAGTHRQAGAGRQAGQTHRQGHTDNASWMLQQQLGLQLDRRLAQGWVVHSCLLGAQGLLGAAVEPMTSCITHGSFMTSPAQVTDYDIKDGVLTLECAEAVVSGTHSRHMLVFCSCLHLLAALCPAPSHVAFCSCPHWHILEMSWVM
jgi:hypothetical protein